MLPETYILNDRITITANDEQYQYRVTYSIFGEILEIELPFLKLPPNAQQLTKGKNTDKYLLDLEFQKKLLRYKIPIAILGFWSTNEFNYLSEAIAERESNLGTDLSDDFLPFISDNWLKEFYIKIKEDVTKKGTGEFWRGLAGLMSNDPVVLTASFRYLRAYSWKLPTEIIGDRWPTISDRRVIRHFYEHAHLYPSEPTKNWLLKELPKENSTFFRGLILKGLSVYTDDTVYKVLLHHYQTQQEMGEGEVEILIFALSEYNTPEVRTIAWKALTGRNYFAAKAAHQVLSMQDVSEVEIAKKLQEAILDKEKSDRINSLLSRFQVLQQDSNLLPMEVFLFQSVYAVRTHKNVRPQTNLASLLDRMWEPKALFFIIDFLHHPEPMVRRLGLDQISSLVVQFPKRIEILNPDTIKRIFQLTSDVNELVKVEAVEVLRCLVPRFGQSSWIIHLLNIPNRSIFLNRILTAILALHRKGFRELATVPFCIKNLSNENTMIKKDSILILQYYKIPEVVNTLNNLPVDSDPTIKEALGRGWREDDDLLRILR